MNVPNKHRFDRLIGLITLVVPALGTAVALLLAALHGFDPSALVLLGGSYVISIVTLEVGYHRMVVHRGFKTHPITRAILVGLGSMAMIGPIGWWTANHRRHHAFSDLPGDPHTPHGARPGLRAKLQAFWHAHAGWLLEEESTTTDPARYASDVYRDPVLRRIHRWYFPLVFAGLAIPGAIGGLSYGSWFGVLQGLLWGGFVRLFCVHHAVWALGSFAHMFGTQSYVTKDEARNNVWVAIPTLGEGWHHNHHAFPSSARHGLEWWQLDFNYGCVRALELLGLAWEVRVPSRQVRDARRKSGRAADKLGGGYVSL